MRKIREKYKIASTIKLKPDKGCVRENNTFFDIQIWLVEDVARFLDVSVGHIYNLTSRREIPFRKKGKRGKLYFIPSEIMQWIDQGE